MVLGAIKCLPRLEAANQIDIDALLFLQLGYSNIIGRVRILLETIESQNYKDYTKSQSQLNQKSAYSRTRNTT